ncbi:PucR family transcriptional regulator [Fundicoccus culcitae]|uniref:PucR family transcriptional regulator ligand-binding domain-containing protein n=1 Tax=Fundicoccus culcitae TaxID=2969821 RepID=A0ABY5P920_9LACT|nr:PucR family transcriptional regulator ligand-binding domain-containing protein [Fundicoccus culcitae]UUX35086.1 PucR family transcriptional regulator ligand-binding domain-containing protein [Fundicoccus culcitae]
METPFILISDVCENSFFQDNIYFMAGRKGAQNKVSQISVMEVEDYVDFDLGENLLVLTTFSFCQSDECKMLAIIKKLVKKNISGLIVKLNRYITNIPAEILDFANENDFPIFIIDSDIAFRSIINHFYELIIHKQYETIFQMNNMYQSLYNSLTTDMTTEQYIEKLDISDDLDYYIESQDEVFYTSPSLANNNDPYLYDYDEADGHFITKREKYDGFEEVTYQKRTLLVFPIKTASFKLGQIIIFSTAEELSLVERMAFTQLASYLSIKLNELRMNQREKLISNGRIYSELAESTKLNKLKSESLLFSTGISPSENYCIIFVSFIDPNLSYDDIERIINKYSNIFFENSTNYFIGYTATGFRIIFGLGNDPTQKNHLFNNFLKTLKDIFIYENIPFKIGISQPFDDPTQIPSAHLQAKSTIEISRKIPGYQDAIFYRDIWDIDLIRQFINSYQYNQINTKVLNPLIEYDACHQVKLFETLEAVVLNDSLKDVSEKLFIHITTLRYRLDKIEQLTGYNFQTNRGKYVLTTAYFAFVFNEN